MLVDYFTYGQPLAEVAADTIRLERAGLDGWFVAEANRDPFLAAALAAEHTERLAVGTGVALAFARNPMSVAYMAHDLHELSAGRFVLGLGSQVKPHIERRFSATWTNPTHRMREFISAFRAIWQAWEHESPVDFRGEYYEHTLMPPAFRPRRLGLPSPPVHLAAVGPKMASLAGEIADGVVCHPLSSTRYLREVTLPAVEAGAARAGRAKGQIDVSGSVMVITGDTDAAVAASAREARERIAFYAATPAYRRVLELHGCGDLQDDARTMTKEGRWDELGEVISEEVVDLFAVRASPDQVGSAIRDRYEGLLDRVNISSRHEFSTHEWEIISEDLHD